MTTERRTIVVSIDAAQAVSYQLPPDVLQYVQSVVATVDATAAGDVKPTLLVATGNGVVIAAEQQGEAIPAGGGGYATWALRLAARQGGAGASFVPQYEFVDTAIFGGDTLPAGGVAPLTWNRNSGDVLLDYTNPKQPTVIAAGVYSFATIVQFDDQFAGWVNGRQLAAILYSGASLGLPVGLQANLAYSNVGPVVPFVALTYVAPLPAGADLNLLAVSSQPTNGLAAVSSTIVRLSDAYT